MSNLGILPKLHAFLTQKVQKNEKFENPLCKSLDTILNYLWCYFKLPNTFLYQEKYVKITFFWKVANFAQNHWKNMNISKITSTYHLKWPEFDDSNRKEDIWWISAHLSKNCRKYLAFLANFGYFFKGKIYRDCHDPCNFDAKYLENR